MRLFRSTFLTAIGILAVTFGSLNAQTVRSMGARSFGLDDGNPAHPRVFLIDNNGSLGIDNTGIITGAFPNTCGALLDLSSVTKGFLPPRMSTLQESAICSGAPPEGLVLYNLTTHSLDVYTGSAYGQSWNSKGNFGTNPVVDFLGTNDPTDLVIRTNFIERMRILANGNVGIGSTTATNTHVQITESGAQTALNVTSTGTGTGVNITTAGTNNLLVVNGTANATAANVAADAVWDSRIIGDQLVTGILKVGGSIWLDGNSATQQILSDAPLNIGTKNNKTAALITNGVQRLTIDASGNTIVTGGNTTVNEGTNQFAINGTGSGYAAKISSSQKMGLEVHCNAQSGTGLNNNTHFIDFFDGAGGNRGSIQGQDNNDLTNDPVYVANNNIYIANTVISGVLIGLTAAAAVASADPFSAPAGVVLVATLAAQIAQVGVAIAQYNIIDGIVKGNLGVSYGSSSGDYAEYLKRTNPDDKLYPGDIVGVRNGMISKNTDGAESIFSISLAPIVLGNVPPKGEENLYNKVGFLGQVPVKVRGAVNEGDFIIASGLNDGIGIAVSPDKITPDELPMLVGRAWSASPLEMVKYVKVAVGLNGKAMSEIMSHEQNEIDALKKEVGELRKSNAEVAWMKSRLDKLEQVITQPKIVKVSSN